VTITFLNRSELFAAEAGYAAQVVRIEGIADGRLGIAVKLLGNKVKPSTAPVPVRPDAANAAAGNDHAAARAPSLAKLREAAAKHANGFVRWGTSLAQLCKRQDPKLASADEDPDAALEQPQNASS
jgi:hypothetical protein